MRLCFHLHKTTMTCMLLWWSLHTDKPSKNFLLGLDTECQMSVCQVSLTVIKEQIVPNVSVAAWRHYSKRSASNSDSWLFSFTARSSNIDVADLAIKLTNQLSFSRIGGTQKHCEHREIKISQHKLRVWFLQVKTAIHFWWVMTDDWEGLFLSLSKILLFCKCRAVFTKSCYAAKYCTNTQNFFLALVQFINSS